MKLCKLHFKVKPSKDHPIFWEWDSGYLQIWLFAESNADAGERAATIIDQLPYERTDNRFDIVFDVTDDHVKLMGDDHAYELRRMVEARGTGLAMELHTLATGGGEVPNLF